MFTRYAHVPKVSVWCHHDDDDVCFDVIMMSSWRWWRVFWCHVRSWSCRKHVFWHDHDVTMMTWWRHHHDHDVTYVHHDVTYVHHDVQYECKIICLHDSHMLRKIKNSLPFFLFRPFVTEIGPFVTEIGVSDITHLKVYSFFCNYADILMNLTQISFLKNSTTPLYIVR